MPSYTVRQGQSLAKIARAAGIHLLDLIAANKQIIDPDLIHAGQKIYLPTKPRSAKERNIAAQRLASGSYSAGTFAADAKGTMMEVGEFWRGPGGGQGAAAQGYTFGEYFKQFGHLPGYLPYGGDVPVGPTGDGAPTITGEEQLEEFQTYLPGEGRARPGAHRGPIGPGGEMLGGDRIRGVFPQRPGAHRGPIGPGGETAGIPPEPRAAPTIEGMPDRPGAHRGPIGPSGALPGAPTETGLLPAELPDVTPAADIQANLGLENWLESAAPVGAMSYGARQNYFKALVANGMDRNRASMLAFGTVLGSEGVQEAAEMTAAGIEPIVQSAQQTAARAKVSNALIKALGQDQARTIAETLHYVYIPSGITEKEIQAIVDYAEMGIDPSISIPQIRRYNNWKKPGFEVSADASPEEHVARQNTEPAALTQEEYVYRYTNPVTLGEKRFMNHTAYSRDAWQLQVNLWNNNTALSASLVYNAVANDGHLRAEELGSQMTDSFLFLYELGTAQPHAIPMLEKAIADAPAGEAKNFLRGLLDVAQTNPEELMPEDSALLSALQKGDRDKVFEAVKAWLEDELEYERRTPNSDQFRITGFDDGTSGTDAVLDPFGTGSGGIGDWAPYGRNYRSPDYKGTNYPSGGNRRGGRTPGFSGNYAGGVTLYNWRMSASGVG